METIRIDCERREADGKGGARRVRRAGRIPAVIYGLGRDAVNLSLEPRYITALKRRPHRFNTLVELSAGDATQLALIKDIQRHPLTKDIYHVDFVRVTEDSEVVVSIPVVRSGRSVGESLGGRVQQPARRIAVRCTPAQIPVDVSLDITKLNIGDRIFVDDLTLPAGVVPVFKERFAVLSIVGGRGTAVAAKAATAEASEA